MFVGDVGVLLESDGDGELLDVIVGPAMSGSSASAGEMLREPDGNGEVLDVKGCEPALSSSSTGRA